MEKTSVQMEIDVINTLDAIARYFGMNRSQVIRKAVENHIEACIEKGEIKWEVTK